MMNKKSRSPLEVEIKNPWSTDTDTADTNNTYSSSVRLGATNPIVVQAMTDTNSEDLPSTYAQCVQLIDAGAQMIRLTVNTKRAAVTIAKLADNLHAAGYGVPLIGDFHYNGHKLLESEPACAIALAKYRINPGNVDSRHSGDKQFIQIIEQALLHKKVVRIGGNWGSLSQKILTREMDRNAKASSPLSSGQVLERVLVDSVLQSAALACSLGLPENRIVLSAKVSEVPCLLRVYRELASNCNFPLHVGLTEAGPGIPGISATACALGILISENIASTIRASITPAPDAKRSAEVDLCYHILSALGISRRQPRIVACPGCGRTTSTYFRKLADEVDKRIVQNMPIWKNKYPGAEKLTIAVMGCVVNGPGESAHADIGISLPGSGEMPVAPVYFDGKKITALKGDMLIDQFMDLIEQYMSERLVVQSA